MTDKWLERLFCLALLFFAVLLLINVASCVRMLQGGVKQEGYEAGLSGVPADACPYTELQMQSWKRGWIEGFKQREQK